jgi:hypothetical protein
MSESAIEQLQRDVQYLKDRLAIQDCIMRHVRGVDRHDVELVRSCYHEDAVDEHGRQLIPGPGYGDWANAAHEEIFTLHAHNITSMNCEIDGDVAYCESYVIGAFLLKDQQRGMFVSGRYVDQLERRDGEWRIVTRRCPIDAVVEGEASLLQLPDARGGLKGVWTTDDVSYQRPLDLDVPGPRW